MISPVDSRYYDTDCAKYLTDEAFLQYKLKVELALINTLRKAGICTEVVYRDVEKACKLVTPAEVALEEKRVGHDIRAMVNCLASKVGPLSKPFIHMLATSCDVVNTANALRYKDIANKVLIPELTKLLNVLIEITEREAETVQIGRTHGQHAVPITFGFAIAQYVSRLGWLLETLLCLTNLPCKFSGAVGAYNSISLVTGDPESFEKDLLLGLSAHPADISTQIVPPEDTIKLFSQLVMIFGVLANLADDMRGLQRTEIAEVSESFGESQVGSSTMPQKRNPISFENIKSMWKIILPRLNTIYLDQISEHQRDLTNSASSRTYGEIFDYLVYTVKRTTKAMSSLVVEREQMKKNLGIQGDLILAEPLYIILATLGHPDAHEAVRVLAQKARETKTPLSKLVLEDESLKKYTDKMTEAQKKVLADPANYTGIAKEKALAIARKWREQVKLYKTLDFSPASDTST